MKYLLTLFLALALVVNLEAQSAGIEFAHTDWQTTLLKAKEDNKIIFVDAYTTWCGPCKWMTANVFPDEAVGDYYNANFINIKMDMEKGEGLEFAKKYKVRAYPSLLFINGDGEMVHKGLGSQAAPDFLALGQSASDPEQQIGGMMTKYKDGSDDPKFLYRYAMALQKAGMNESADIAKQYLASQDNWKSKENITFIYEMVDYDMESKLYQFMSEHKKMFYEQVEVEGVDQKLKRGIYMSLRKMKGASDEQVADLYKSVFPENYQRHIDEYRLNILQRGKTDAEKAEFLEFAVKYMNTYEVDSWQMLNSLAWTFFERTDDERYLKEARKWAKKSVELDSNFMNNDTLAAVCYKLKEKAPAAKHAELAIELAKADGSDYSETAALLEKINALK